MYLLFAIFAVIAGICLFIFAKRMTKNRLAVKGLWKILEQGNALYDFQRQCLADILRDL